MTSAAIILLAAIAGTTAPSLVDSTLRWTSASAVDSIITSTSPEGQAQATTVTSSPAIAA